MTTIVTIKIEDDIAERLADEHGGPEAGLHAATEIWDWFDPEGRAEILDEQREGEP